MECYSYMVDCWIIWWGSVRLYNGECCVTLLGVLGYVVGSVVLYGGCWITWKGVLDYLAILLLGNDRLILARGMSKIFGQ